MSACVLSNLLNELGGRGRLNIRLSMYFIAYS